MSLEGAEGDRKVTKWLDVPVHPETGVARNMGIAFDRSKKNLFVCDNQGWSERPEVLYKGRILKLTVNDEGIEEWKTVAYHMEHPTVCAIGTATFMSPSPICIR